jgi:hypothetical protein
MGDQGRLMGETSAQLVSVSYGRIQHKRGEAVVFPELPAVGEVIFDITGGEKHRWSQQQATAVRQPRQSSG